jgi:hypothetical protein
MNWRDDILKVIFIQIFTFIFINLDEFLEFMERVGEGKLAKIIFLMEKLLK